MGKKLTVAQCESRGRLFDEAAEAIGVYCPDDSVAESELLEQAYVMKKIYALSQYWYSKAFKDQTNEQ